MPIEIIGLFARIFALIVRLCANMVAGHVLLAVLLSFIFSAAANGIASALGVAVPVVLGSIAIMLLEIFVGVSAGVHFHLPDDPLHRPVDRLPSTTTTMPRGRRRTDDRDTERSPCPEGAGADRP